MDIRNVQYRLRRRRLDEIFDFALLIMRTHFLRFVSYSAPAFVLFVGFNISLLVATDTHGGDFWSQANFGMMLLILAEQPLFALPLILLNGNLVFNSRPPAPQVLAALPAVLPSYVLRNVLWRSLLLTAFAPALITVWRGAVHQFFLAEVILLERLSGRDVGRRLSALTQGRSDRTVAFLLLDGALAVLFVVCATYSYNLLLRAVGLVDAHPLLQAEYTFLSPSAHVFLFVFFVFHSTAKFLFYLDLRSLLEGWDIELLLLKGIQDTDAAPGGLA